MCLCWQLCVNYCNVCGGVCMKAERQGGEPPKCMKTSPLPDCCNRSAVILFGGISHPTASMATYSTSVCTVKNNYRLQNPLKVSY